MDWSAASSIAGAVIGGAGAAWANSQSAAAAKEMYKKRYQWQVKDLKAAGLNPMLSYMNSAPVPSQPHVQNVGESAVKGASTAAAIRSMAVQNKLTEEQTNLARMTANKEAAIGEAQEMTNAINRADPLYQAAIKPEVDGGHKGTSALAQERWDLGMQKLRGEADQAREAAEKAAIEVKRASNDYEREKALAPLQVAHQEYVNKGLKLGLSQKEADAAFYEVLGGWAKGSGLVAEAAKLYMLYMKSR